MMVHIQGSQGLPKVQIVSRYVPAENVVGHYTYLLDFMRYLRHADCKLELVALDPLFGDATIPPEVQEIADVYVRKLPQMESKTSEGRLLSRCKTLLRPFYMRLPGQYLYIARKIFYWLRGKEIYEAKNWDALPTNEEMKFAKIRFETFQPDVVIANYTFLGRVLDLFSDNKRILKVILTWDIRYQRVESYRKGGYQPDDSNWTWKNESELLCKADVLLAIQKDDAKTLQKMAPECEVLCAPMSTKYSLHNNDDQIPRRCMFVGSNVDHNVYGIRWFLKDVWPIILCSLPDASLNVCGSVCYEIHEEFPNVRLINSLGPWNEVYAATEVCLIPLVVGSGLKIKLVEALSHGRACVSTSVGIQGIQELTNKAILVADTAEEFAEAVITILNNPKKRKKMEEQARKYVIENLSPEKVYQPFVDRIYQHVSQQNN